MLRKILTLAVTAVLAKKAWDQVRAMQAEAERLPPPSSADVQGASALTAVPVLPESPMQYH